MMHRVRSGRKVLRLHLFVARLAAAGPLVLIPLFLIERQQGIMHHDQRVARGRENAVNNW